MRTALVALALALVAIAGRGPQGRVDAQVTTRIFSGTFTGSGTFSNSLCTWLTTYTGSAVLTLTFSGSSVTGTARHQGSYRDQLTSGPSECGDDSPTFNETVPVSGTAQNLRWALGHGVSGAVTVTASLIGNAIVGRGVVTDPDYTGSATIPFTFPQTGGSSPTPEPEESTPAPVATATSAAPRAASPATPASPALPPSSPGGAAQPAVPAVPAAPSTSAPGTPVGAAGGKDSTVVPIAPVPTVPQSKDADPAAVGTKQKTCEEFSTDPAIWEALEAHLDSFEKEEIPIHTAKECIAMYRARPWPQRPGGYRSVETAEREAKQAAEARGEAADKGPAPKATLQTETALVFRPTEQGQSTTVLGATLGKGDTVVTRDKAATVGFSEGSSIELGPKSAIVMGDPAERSVVQLRGRLFMDIKSRQWVVRIPQTRGMVSVVNRGTKFSTEILPDGNVRVEVTESAVEVTSGEKTVTVRAGTSITVVPGDAPPAPPQAPAESSRGVSPATYGLAAAAVVAVGGGAAFMLMRRRGRGGA